MTPLPVLTDCIDFFAWNDQVQEVLQALVQSEDDSPTKCQRIIDALKISLKGQRIHVLSKSLEGSNDCKSSDPPRE